MKTDLYATRAYDDNMEILCTAPDELPADKPFGGPASCLAAAFVDITRTAATALHREYSHDLPKENTHE